MDCYIYNFVALSFSDYKVVNHFNRVGSLETDMLKLRVVGIQHPTIPPYCFSHINLCLELA